MIKAIIKVAKIHAENAIRQKNQSLNFLRMSARIDATASRVQSAVTTKKVSKSMEVLHLILLYLGSLACLFRELLRA